MLNKLTYFVQREPVTPAKRNNLLCHSLRTTLNSSAITHPIVSKYTVTVKIKNTWVWNTSHTNTAHLLANTKANVMETPAVSQPQGSHSQAWQTPRMQPHILQHNSREQSSCTSSRELQQAIQVTNAFLSLRFQHRKSWRATVTDFAHQSKLRLWLKVQVNNCHPWWEIFLNRVCKTRI